MTFSLTPAYRRIEKPWGFEVIFTSEGERHTGKLLFLLAGKRLSLQYHDAKEEIICLQSGRAVIWLEDEAGEVRHLPMEPLKGYAVRLNQKHRLEALDDSWFVEVSDPEKGNTVRLIDDYARPTETEELRSRPDRGWGS